MNPRVFQTGAVYTLHTARIFMEYDDFYLILGPSQNWFNEHNTYPAEYRYLNLLTGEISEFHRNSFFGEYSECLSYE